MFLQNFFSLHYLGRNIHFFKLSLIGLDTGMAVKNLCKLMTAYIKLVQADDS
jgi:hypothetical protein